MPLFKRKPSKLRRVLADFDREVEESRAIPAGARIYTSESPKVTVAHVKSALNPGAVCEAMSQREGPWLGTGSEQEREHAAGLRLSRRCRSGDYGEGKAAAA